MADGAPLTIRLELARAEDTGDAYAFRTGPQDYILRWEGGAFEQARLVWDDALQQDLAAVRLPGRDPELVRRIGVRLQRFLEPTRFRDLAAQIQAAALAGRPVHLDIVSAAAELYTLPWELLTLGDGRHLGELPDIVLQYRWPGAQPAPPARLPRPEGGRILLAWSRAFGGVGDGLTVDAIDAAARAGFVAFDRVKDVLPDMSLATLVAELERRVAGPDPPAILHVLAHGAPVGRSYGLGLDDGRGGREVVDAAALRRALAPFAAHLRLVVLMTCDGGNPGPLGALLGSSVQELHRAGFEAVVGSRFPLAGGAALEFTGALYGGLLERTCSIDQAFTAARARLARGTGLDWASLMLHGHARPGRGARPIVFRPHRGLLAFEREHARFFFGRDAERREAVADLQRLIADGQPRFLVVAGASGTGKSSVVLAGVVPDVEALGWAVAVMRPGRAPMRALDEALALRPDDGRPCLLVIDQFEEIFTHADVSDGDPSAFARRLWDLSRSPSHPTQVLVTLRVDYLGRCGEIALDAAGLRLDKVAYDETHRLFVAQMTPDRLAETIAGPLARVGLSLETGLDRRLLDEIGGDPTGLPLLQYALDELWKRRQDDALTHAALDEIGGVVGALAHHADAAVDALPPEGQAQARRLLVRLVAYGADPSSGTRRRELEVDLRPARDPAAFDRAAAALIDARLLVRREADDRVTLEVAHEALIRHWARLWGWYEEDRATLARHRELDEIVAQAKQHDELLAGNLLVAAEALVHSLGDDVDPDARALVQQSRAAADRATRRLRLIRASVVASLLVTLAVVLTSRQNVARQAERAEAAKRRSDDVALIATAFSQTYERPHVAAELLLEVEDSTLPQWRQTAFTTSLALSPTAIDRPPPTHVLAAVTAAAVLPGGAELVTGHADGAVRLWPLGPEGQDLSLLLVRPGEPGPGRAIDQLDVRADPGGPTFLAAGRTTLHAWRRTPRGVAPLLARADLPPTTGATGHLLGPDGLLAAWIDDDASGVGDLAVARMDGAPVASLTQCRWLDPAAGLAACGEEPHLFTWSGADIGPLARVAVDALLTATTATAFTPPRAAEDDAPILVDPVGRRFADLDAGRIDARNLFWFERGTGDLCRRPRGGPRRSCGALPSTCGTPRMLAVHPGLGPLVQCRSGEARLLVVDATVPVRTQAERDAELAALDGGLPPADPEPVADVRLELAAPDGALVDAFLLDDGARLVAITRDNRLWRWDLREPASGWLAHATHAPAVAALVHGTSSVLELAPVAGGDELRLLHWDDPTLPPTVARVTLPTAGLMRPGVLVADADGWLGAIASPIAFNTSDPVEALLRAGGTTHGQRNNVEVGVSVLWGSLPPDPPRGRVDTWLASSALFATRPAARAGLGVLPRGEGYSRLDLAAPVEDPPTSPAPRLREDEPDLPNGVAVHRSGEHMVLLWQQSPAALIARSGAAVATLAPADGPGCGETDRTALIATAAAYAPDGRRLALGYATGRLELWPTLADGRLDPAGAPRVLCRARAPLVALAFAPDGEAVVSGTASSNLTIWSGLSRPDGVRGPLSFWLPGRPALRDLTLAADRLQVLTRTGRVWFSHTDFDRDRLAERLRGRSAICLYQSERVQLLGEDPATAAAAEAACTSKHDLKDTLTP